MESIKRSISLFILFCTCCVYYFDTHGQNNPSKQKAIHESHFDFSLDYNQLNKGKFQYYIGLVDKELNKMEIKGFHFTLPNNPIKIINDLETQQQIEERIPRLIAHEDSFYRILNKTIYQVNKSIHFFSKAQLSDIEYIKKILPKYKISKDNNLYHIDTGFLSVDFDYVFFYYKNPERVQKLSFLVNFVKEHTPKLNLSPSIMLIQHNFNYGKVLFQNTSRMSFSIQTFYEIAKDKTLIINYTLNQVYNFPPQIFMDKHEVVSVIIKSIESLIEQTNAYNNKRPWHN